MIGDTPNSVQIILILACFVVSFISAWLLAQYPQFLPDIPNNRSAHRRVVSRGGGICFILPVLAGSLILVSFNRALLDNALLTFLLGGVIVSLIGLVDDAISQPALPRLILQLIVVSLLTIFGAPERLRILGVIEFTGWPVYLIQIFWLLGCINFFNFMDGLDGLAAFQAIFLSSLIGILLLMDYENIVNNQITVDTAVMHGAQYNKLMSTFFFALAAVMVGYFAWNLPPARIFMGDNGSYFLGFVFGYSALIFPYSSSQKNLPVTVDLLKQDLVPVYMGFTAVFILLAPFLMDATLTLFKRILKKKNIFTAHREHFFQLLHRDGWSPMKIILLLAALDTLALIPLGLYILRLNSVFIFSLIMVLLFFGTLVYFVVGDRLTRKLERNEHRGPVIDMVNFKKRARGADS